MLKTKQSELLSAYLDKELSGSELLEVQNQLGISSEWREELERIKKIKETVSALSPVSAPADFLDSIERQFHAHQAQKRRPFFSWTTFLQPWVLGGSLATAGILIGVFHLQHPSEPKFLELEPLIAAHSTGLNSPILHQKLLAASEQSEQIKNHVQS